MPDASSNQGNKDTRKAITEYVRLYGDQCMAYSTLQPKLEYFIAEGVGFIAYRSFWHPIFAPLGRKIVLSDPVADKSHYPALMEAFIRQHKRVIFVQLHDDSAKVLHNMGYEVNQFGVETELPIATYDLAGKAKEKLRQWRNKCQREGVVVSEAKHTPSLIDEMKRVSADWLQGKGDKEIGFLTRPMVYAAEDDARCFIARDKQGALLAFAVFDPIYKQSQVIGYYHNADRMVQTAPHGVGAYIVLQALEVFKTEQRQVLSLGMSPLYKIKDNYNHHAFTAKALKYAYKNLNNLYPFQGNAGHKKKFAGQTRKVYISSSRTMNVRELLLMLKALGLT